MPVVEPHAPGPGHHPLHDGAEGELRRRREARQRACAPPPQESAERNVASRQTGAVRGSRRLAVAVPRPRQEETSPTTHNTAMSLHLEQPPDLTKTSCGSGAVRAADCHMQALRGCPTLRSIRSLKRRRAAGSEINVRTYEHMKVGGRNRHARLCGGNPRARAGSPEFSVKIHSRMPTQAMGCGPFLRRWCRSCALRHRTYLDAYHMCAMMLHVCCDWNVTVFPPWVRLTGTTRDDRRLHSRRSRNPDRLAMHGSRRRGGGRAPPQGAPG